MSGFAPPSTTTMSASGADPPRHRVCVTLPAHPRGGGPACEDATFETWVARFATRCGRYSPSVPRPLSRWEAPTVRTFVGDACRLPHQPPPERVGVGDRRRQPDRLQARRERAEPREAEGEQVAALAGDQRVEFVEDHRVEVGEETARRRWPRRGAPPAPASSAGCRAASASAAGACGPACRRSASRSRRRAPSRGPASRGSARCRRRAP